MFRVGGEDVVLGFSDMAGYTSAEGRGKNPYMGAVVTTLISCPMAPLASRTLWAQKTIDSSTQKWPPKIAFSHLPKSFISSIPHLV